MIREKKSRLEKEADKWLKGYRKLKAKKNHKPKPKQKKAPQPPKQNNRSEKIKMSPGEKQVAKALGVNGVAYIREHCFPDMFYKGKLISLYFDFWIPEHNLCIEFDGLHHFTGMYKGFEKPNVKRNDEIKNRYCKRRGIHLLRIPCFAQKRIEEIICAKFDEISPIA